MVEKIFPIDPAASTEHLTPGGKHKRRKINRQEQIVRYEESVDRRANELIPTGVPPLGENIKRRIKKIIGIDD